MAMLNYFYVKCSNGLRRLFKEEKGGAEIVAIVLILVVVVGLAIIFRNQIGGMVKRIIAGITGKEAELSEFN